MCTFVNNDDDDSKNILNFAQALYYHRNDVTDFNFRVGFSKVSLAVCSSSSLSSWLRGSHILMPRLFL